MAGGWGVWVGDQARIAIATVGCGKAVRGGDVSAADRSEHRCGLGRRVPHEFPPHRMDSVQLPPEIRHDSGRVAAFRLGLNQVPRVKSFASLLQHRLPGFEVPLH